MVFPVNDLKAIIFDLDGTLVHSAPEILFSANSVLQRFGLPELDVESDAVAAGQGRRAIFERSLAKGKMAMCQREQDEIFSQIYPLLLAEYEQELALGSKLYDGVSDCLASLVDSGLKLGVCTNKDQGLAEAILASSDVIHFFTAIAGVTDDDVRKPDPRHLRRVCDALTVDPEQSVLVGDSTLDAVAAYRLSMPFIHAAFGYHDNNLPIEPRVGTAQCFNDLTGLSAIVAVTGNGR